MERRNMDAPSMENEGVRIHGNHVLNKPGRLKRNQEHLHMQLSLSKHYHLVTSPYGQHPQLAC